ncbi:MAG: hypothetical protein Q8S13_07455 [Dehalococcoidia bacterium]|nr:hypothetical protein [Dehalococcoidia bacterium]
MAGPSFRVDLRAVLPITALGVVVLVIILVELCGREDLPPLQETAAGERATVPLGPTFTPGAEATAPPEEPTAPPATPEGEGSGEERDLLRAADLQTIAGALEEFRDENDSYPDSGGNIQTLCAFEGTDVGCELEDVLDPLPEDPLGSPAGTGYWYQSDGDSYVIYAQRESDAVPECDEHPMHLAVFESLLCVEGP